MRGSASVLLPQEIMNAFACVDSHKCVPFYFLTLSKKGSVDRIDWDLHRVVNEHPEHKETFWNFLTHFLGWAFILQRVKWNKGKTSQDGKPICQHSSHSSEPTNNFTNTELQSGTIHRAQICARVSMRQTDVRGKSH